SVAGSLTARGVVTVTGIPFTYWTLPRLLALPRYAGLMPDGQSPAAWEPVLDRAEWEELRAVLDGRAARFRPARAGRVHLLSGIAECWECGWPLQLRQSRKRPGNESPQTWYGCREPGCMRVFRSMRMLDEYVIGRVLGRLAKAENPEGRLPSA